MASQDAAKTALDLQIMDHEIDAASAALLTLATMICTSAEKRFFAEFCEEFEAYTVAFKKLFEASQKNQTASTQVPILYRELAHQARQLYDALDAFRHEVVPSTAKSIRP